MAVVTEDVSSMLKKCVLLALVVSIVEDSVSQKVIRVRTYIHLKLFGGEVTASSAENYEVLSFQAFADSYLACLGFFAP